MRKIHAQLLRSKLLSWERTRRLRYLQAKSVPEALDRACTLAGRKGVIVITGSIYIVGEALGILARKPVRQGA